MNVRAQRLALLVSCLSALGCSGGTKYIGSNGAPGPCAPPTAPPAELGLDPFYTQYLDAGGVPIVSSSNVSDTALLRACDTAVHMLRADVRARMAQTSFRFAVIGIEEVLTGLPEFSDLGTRFPDVDWDYTVRSVGASREYPVSNVGEENLLCLADDIFAGESITIHSMAHGLRTFGIVDFDPDWDVRLRDAYDTALSAGLWADTYAATEAPQYWAEGVQSFYDANLEATPPNGIHNEINTRAELRAYDPALASLIEEYVPDDGWRPACLAGK